MKKILVSLLFGVLASSVFSQNTLELILADMDINNIEIQTTHDQTVTEKINAKLYNNPDNPQIGFNYLWGNTNAPGNRKDFSIRQSIEFPTVYRYRAAISDIKGKQYDYQYESDKNDILLKARILLYQLIYWNEMSQECDNRIKDAQILVDAYDTKLKSGESSILEVNKAKWNYISLQQQTENCKLQKKMVIQELQAMNNGQSISTTNLDYPIQEIPKDFETWIAKDMLINPRLQALKTAFQASQEEIKLNKAVRLPNLEAGYMSEQVMDESFAGISFGMSIPLWQNKKTVKHAIAQSSTYKSQIQDYQIHTYHYYKSLFEQAKIFDKSIEEFEEVLQDSNHNVLLKKALDQGELSLIDYLKEIELFYEIREKIIQLKLNKFKVLAELYRYAN